MKNIVFLLTLLILIHTSKAQSLPWQDQPFYKTFTTWTDTFRVHLKLDTLYALNRDSSSFVEKNWYTGVNKIGYGYVDDNNQPVGLWKYYTQDQWMFTLYCMGSYALINANNLRVDPAILKTFSSADDLIQKYRFAEEKKDKFYFTGEWRFYKKGRLDKIISMDHGVYMPYFITQNIEGTEFNLLMDMNEDRRLAASEIYTTWFYPNGYIKRIISSDLDQSFSEDGKPIIEPLEIIQ